MFAFTLEKVSESQAGSFDLANLAFPNSQDTPSSLSQLSPYASITLSISLNFR